MGFIIHDEKPVLDPTQKPKHIGFAFDFVSMTTSLTEKKNDKKNWKICVQNILSES